MIGFNYVTRGTKILGRDSFTLCPLCLQRGILMPKLRILPLPLAAPSEDGRMAHKLFGVASSAHYENDYIGEITNFVD